MKANYPKCVQCIKSDVCGIKDDIAFAHEQIMTVNTSREDCAIHLAKDNKNLDITVLCNKFSPKNGTAYRNDTLKGGLMPAT